MPTPTKTTLLLILALLIVGAGFILTRQGEIIGVDQLGVVVSPGGRIAVYKAGDQPLVLPLIQNIIRLTAKPIRYELTEAKAISITGPNQNEIKISCQVRYQIEDAAKLVHSQGAAAPQTAIEALILQQLTAQFNTTLQQAGASLDDVQTRISMVGDIHQNLKQTLAPFGIGILAFDLISW